MLPALTVSARLRSLKKMKAFISLAFLCGMTMETIGQTPATPDLEGGRTQYQQSLQKIAADRQLKLGPIQKAYADRLQQLRQKAGGDANLSMAVEEEQQRLAKEIEPTDEERVAMPKPLLALRMAFEKERQPALAAATQLEAQITQAWVTKLQQWYRVLIDPLQTDRTAANKAAAVKAELDLLTKKPEPVAKPAAAAPPPKTEPIKPAAPPKPDRKAALEIVRQLKLVKPPKLREGEDVLAGAVSLNPELLKGARSVELLRAFDASEEPMKRNSGESKRMTGAWAKSALVGSNSGILLWGPSDLLQAGRYIVVYRLKLLKPPTEKALAFLDIARNGVTVHGIRPEATIAPVKEWTEIGVSLTLDKDLDVEYRLWPHKHEVAVDRIYIYRIDVP
jgi:hypothetical protein